MGAESQYQPSLVECRVESGIWSCQQMRGGSSILLGSPYPRPAPKLLPTTFILLELLLALSPVPGGSLSALSPLNSAPAIKRSLLGAPRRWRSLLPPTPSTPPASSSPSQLCQFSRTAVFLTLPPLFTAFHSFLSITFLSFCVCVSFWAGGISAAYGGSQARR